MNRPLAITASTATSALGRGAARQFEAIRDRRGGLRPCDFAGVTRGYVGRVAAIDDHALPPSLLAWDCRNNRLADLALRADGFADAVAAAAGRYGPARVAVVVGTSTSGVLSGEDAYRRRDDRGALPAAFDHGRTQDLYSLARFVRAALGLRGPAATVSVACASSARAFAEAAALIGAGMADAAVVGGADTLCGLTLRGFASLDLVSAGPCRPGDVARDGVSIGEAAGFALLERGEGAVSLLGWGSSSDGHHMSAPHPEGQGATAAMRAALARAGVDAAQVDWVNLHGTGTRANDATEDRAVHAVFGDTVPCSSTKGWTGHTLGACGVLELVIALGCMAHGLRPAGLGLAEVDPAFRARVLRDALVGPVRRVLSNSFGFGGVNASLLIGAA